MEVGRMAEIENAQVNYTQKIEKVQETAKKDKVDLNEQYKNHQRGENKVDNEVILDNVHFGFNKKSQDFFVKIVRNDVEYKYPSDEMMNLKAHLMDALKDLNQND